MRWFLEFWLLAYLVLISTASEQSSALGDNIPPATSARSGHDGVPFADVAADVVRTKRAAAIIQGPTGSRLIDEKQCPEVRNLCNSHDNIDDLSVLECIQTFLTNQIESISDDCQHTIWRHTKDIMSDAVVLRLVEKPCQPIVGE